MRIMDVVFTPDKKVRVTSFAVVEGISKSWVGDKMEYWEIVLETICTLHENDEVAADTEPMLKSWPAFERLIPIGTEEISGQSKVKKSGTCSRPRPRRAKFPFAESVFALRAERLAA
jgi:hypothetical protein